MLFSSNCDLPHIWAKNAHLRDLFLDGFDGKIFQEVCIELGKIGCLIGVWKQLFKEALWSIFLDTDYTLLMDEWDVMRKKGFLFSHENLCQ